MSNDPQPYEKFNLGHTVWEADPWNEQVHRRKIIQITTVDSLDLCGVQKTTRQVRISGGILGLGEVLSPSNWGVKYFLDKEAARRACCEQAVKLRAEKRAQVESEIAELQKELSSESM